MTTDTDHDADTSADRPEDPAAARSGRASDAARAAARPKGATGSTARQAPSVAPRRAPEPQARAASAPRPPAAPSTARLPWILAVLGLVGTVAFGTLWLSGLGDDDGGAGSGETSTTAEVKAASEAFALALTNFDGATIDADVDKIVALSTGDFRDEVDQFFGADTRKQLKEASASSRGEVRSSYVQTVDGDRGTAFVVMDQTIANNRSPQPKADTLRMEVALRRVDGSWLVQRVDVLEAPSGTYGGTPDAGADGPTTTAPAGATTTVPGG